MAEVHLPKTLLPLFAGLHQVEDADGETVADALTALDARHPGLLDRLSVDGRSLRPHIRVFVGRAPAGLDTAVGADSRVDVITAITGG